MDGALNPLSKVLKGLVSNLFMNLSTKEFRHHVFPKNFDNFPTICSHSSLSNFTGTTNFP